MSNTIKAAEIMMLRSDETTYPVTDVITLPADAELEFVERKSRQTGTGYEDHYYKILGTNDALVVHKYNYRNGDGFYDTVEIYDEYFSRQRSYGKECRQLAKKLGCPTDLVLAIGPEKIEEFLQLVAEAEPISSDIAYEMDCGIDRRKAGILQALPRLADEKHHDLCLEIEYSGQINSTRIAQYLGDTLPIKEPPKKTKRSKKKKERLEKYQTAGIGTSLASLLANVQVQ